MEKYSALVFIFFIIYSYQCLKIIPQRALLSYMNENYFESLTISVRRYSRKSDYVINVEFISKRTLENNVTMELIFFEYLHNEYRRSFIELRYKLCDLIHKDPYLGSSLRKAGLVTCPMPPGKVTISNITLNIDVTSVWPFEAGKAEVTALVGTTGELMCRGEFMMKFKSKN